MRTSPCASTATTRARSPCSRPRWDLLAPGPTGPAWWEDRVLAGNLDVLHAAVASRWRLGRRGLRGDLATDVSGVARVVGDLTGDPEAAARAARSFLDRPDSRLRGLGVVVVAGDADRRAVVYERNTCCLIVKAVPGAYCTNCPLIDSGQRRASRQHSTS